MIEKTCEHCHKVFLVPSYRDSARFCSRKCSDEHPRSEKNATCDYCRVSFHIKPSQLKRYSRKIGVFCSTKCLAEGKKKAYEGAGNPNYKNKNTDSDGYRIQPPSARRMLNHTVKRVHQAVACEAIGITKIPTGYHVHHRDCNILNNSKENLSVLTVSDHKWLQKQFGIATLWAFCQGKIEMELMIDWSDDRDRARMLLPINLVNGQMQYLSLRGDSVRGTGGFGSTGQ